MYEWKYGKLISVKNGITKLSPQTRHNSLGLYLFVCVCICVSACVGACLCGGLSQCRRPACFSLWFKTYTSLSNCLILSESVCLPNRKYILEHYMLRQRPCDHGSPVEDQWHHIAVILIPTDWDLPLTACNRLDVKPPEIFCFWPLSLLDLQLQ